MNYFISADEDYGFEEIIRKYGLVPNDLHRDELHFHAMRDRPLFRRNIADLKLYIDLRVPADVRLVCGGVLVSFIRLGSDDLFNVDF